MPIHVSDVPGLGAVLLGVTFEALTLGGEDTHAAVGTVPICKRSSAGTSVRRAQLVQAQVQVEGLNGSMMARKGKGGDFYK